ncbi:hypothetical protein [Tardiphaga sp.]|uniref:hypothetical protein n=1 Tax=Tardiphaga sp. TaxID=1926292 RepID=UPI0037D9976B
MPATRDIAISRSRRTAGNTGAGGPVKLKSYTVAGLPSAASAGAGAIVYVSNAATAACVAWSDGTNWKRADTGATVT